MSLEHRALNYAKLKKYVFKYTSAFWGQSFVAELTRISAHGEKKLKLRRASLGRRTSSTRLPEGIAPNGTQDADADEGVDMSSPRQSAVQPVNAVQIGPIEQ